MAVRCINHNAHRGATWGICEQIHTIPTLHLYTCPPYITRSQPSIIAHPSFPQAPWIRPRFSTEASPIVSHVTEVFHIAFHIFIFFIYGCTIIRPVRDVSGNFSPYFGSIGAISGIGNENKNAKNIIFPYPVPKGPRE